MDSIRIPTANIWLKMWLDPFSLNTRSRPIGGHIAKGRWYVRPLRILTHKAPLLVCFTSQNELCWALTAVHFGQNGLQTPTGKPFEAGTRGFWKDYPNIEDLVCELGLKEEEDFSCLLLFVITRVLSSQTIASSSRTFFLRYFQVFHKMFINFF